MPVFELLPAKNFPILLPAATNGLVFPSNIQFDVFGGFLQVLPSFSLGPIELGPSTWCDECGWETKSLEQDCNDEWHWTCHEVYCSCCSEWGDSDSTYICQLCETCQSDSGSQCCDCIYCESCSEYHSSNDSYCGECYGVGSCCSCTKCESCHEITKYGVCDCGDCSDCCHCSDDRDDADWQHLSCILPGWIVRKETCNGLASTRDMMAEDLELLSPVESMADFYLLDYIMATVAMSLRKCAGPNIRNVAFRSRIILATSAKALQDSLVARCDAAFRDYVFAVIGGEVRYHPNVSGKVPSGRSDAWDYWLALGNANGRIDLISDCVDLFYDENAFSGGGSIGGPKWGHAARILLERETGKLDAKTFVDRVFNAQHNGGSLLNKMTWAGKEVGRCQRIGDAHSADIPDFHTLLKHASADVRTLMVETFRWIAEDSNDRPSCQDAIRPYLPVVENVEQEESPALDPELEALIAQEEAIEQGAKSASYAVGAILETIPANASASYAWANAIATGTLNVQPCSTCNECSFSEINGYVVNSQDIEALTTAWNILKGYKAQSEKLIAKPCSCYNPHCNLVTTSKHGLILKDEAISLGYTVQA